MSSAQTFAARGHRELAMLHAFRADEGIGHLPDLTAAATDDQDFQAVIVIQMDMHRRQDELMVPMLNIGELLVQGTSQE